MPLKILPADAPVPKSGVVCVIYGQPGIGKTSLAMTARKPVLLDFDAGFKRSAKKLRCPRVEVKSWEDAAVITAADVEEYRTIIVDTAGRCVNLMQEHIHADKKNKLTTSAGVPTLKGWGWIKVQFERWLSGLRTKRRNIVLLTHTIESGAEGQHLRVDIQGGSKEEVYKVADVMGSLSMQGGQRVLRLSPSDTQFGKNPAQLPELTVPAVDALDGWLEEQVLKPTADALFDDDEELAMPSTPEEATALVKTTKMTTEEKGRLWTHVKQHGWAYDADSKQFIIT